MTDIIISCMIRKVCITLHILCIDKSLIGIEVVYMTHPKFKIENQIQNNEKKKKKKNYTQTK